MAKQPSSSTPVPPASDAEASAPVIGKGTRTPTRREREAANKRPLVPTDRKEAARAARAKNAELREKARIGMANGDERYLPTRDRGPQRKFVRDYVDARYSLGEFMIPVVFALIILTYIPAIAAYGLITVYAYFLLALADVVILGFVLKRKLAAKFGEEKVEKGFRFYAAMRALQLRPLRLPKPQVKRRQYPA